MTSESGPMTGNTARPAIDFVVNGRAVTVRVDPMRRLSDVLRDDLGLIGTKVGCEAGDCGACTVRLGGRQVESCLVPLRTASAYPFEGSPPWRRISSTRPGPRL